jgi:hypothetical protein
MFFYESSVGNVLWQVYLHRHFKTIGNLFYLTKSGLDKYQTYHNEQQSLIYKQSLVDFMKTI